MSEYNDIGRHQAKEDQVGEKSEKNQPLTPGTQVRVFTPVRNDPNQHTIYVFEGLVDTPEGQKAKLSFKTAGGKTFYRVAHPDDVTRA